MRTRFLGGSVALGLAIGLACGKGPASPQVTTTSTVNTTTSVGPTSSSTSTVSSSSSSTSTSSSSSTTTVGDTDSQRYIGTYQPPAPSPQVPLDFSVFYKPPKGDVFRRLGLGRPTAVADVTGGYNTGPGSFTGSISGTLDGSIGNGTFTGVITANLGGCVASRNYSGPLTAAALNFLGGSHINTCGGSTPLTSGMNAPASNLPATTTSTSTSVQPESVLVFTFSPNPAPPLTGPTTRCSQTPLKTWEFRLTIQNNSSVPFTINFWAVNIEGQQIQDRTADDFAKTFGVSTIQPFTSVSGSLCVALNATSGSVRYFFNGLNGNGPHVTPFLQLLQ